MSVGSTCGIGGKACGLESHTWTPSLAQERRTVLFNRQPTAPSVPARHQSYGYEEVWAERAEGE